MPYIELKSGTSDISTRYGTAKFLSFSAVDTNTCTHNDMNTHIHTHTHTHAHTYVHVSFILNQRCVLLSLSSDSYAGDYALENTEATDPASNTP